MNRKEIMATIEALAGFQGFYGRLLAGIRSMRHTDREMFFGTLEAQNFKDGMDLVMYFES